MLAITLLFECSSAGLVDTPDADNVIDERVKNTPIYAALDVPKKKSKPVQALESASIEVETKLAEMTVEEKIGQLFMSAVYTNKGPAEVKRAKALVKDYHLGGVALFRDSKKTSSPTQQVAFTNDLQAQARIPLMVSIDAEWGLDMRLDSTVQFPRQLTLGAIQDDQYIYNMGFEIGRQCKRMGIHMNFAPVVDVNNNPNNPVINDRSFGENMFQVANKGTAYMRGLHDAGVLATAKHFPGHGDTDKDSHLTLPQINHDRRRIDSLEFYPFRQMIENRLGAMMIAHLNIPALDPSPNRPSTLSTPIVTGVLRNEMGFDGLIITDALNMKGVTNTFPPGTIEVEAIKAGNDILLFSVDVPKAFQAIKSALQTGEITESRIDASVRKILYAKRWLGILENVATSNPQHVTDDINQGSVKLLKQQLHEKSITLVKNDDLKLPLSDLSKLKIATVSINDGKLTPFQSTLDNYAPMTHFSVSASDSEVSYNNLLKRLEGYNMVLVGLVNQSRYSSRGYGISLATKTFLRQLNDQNKLVLSVFGNPYSIENFVNYRTVICGYDGAAEAQKAAAEAIMGVIGFEGRLPVAAGYLPVNYGNITTGNMRIKHAQPYEIGLEDHAFYKLDSIAKAAISIKATPGCQLLVAKDNKIVYHKAFGHHTYSRKRRVQLNDVYDVASITKISSTLPALMFGYERGVFHPEDQLQQHLFITKGSNKANMKIAEVLNHTSGLKSWIPFYTSTLTEDGKLNNLYARTKSSGKDIEIAKGMYLQSNYPKDSMMMKILKADNNPRGRYVYSDLGYYLFQHMLEEQYSQPLEEFVERTFYQPLGMSTMGYNPTKRFPLNKIVPTEKDEYWRNQLVHGYVHDMGAAMQDGVGGHAGVFSNANDLAIYMQMLLNKGTYGGQKYFEPSTIEYFTRRYSQKSRRGLGFDKPETDRNKIGPTSESTPASAFGHTGFTGTCAWADPENNLIFIFLSNRVHPTMDNKKLITEDIRPQIQEAIYEVFDLQQPNQ